VREPGEPTRQRGRLLNGRGGRRFDRCGHIHGNTGCKSDPEWSRQDKPREN
jgi:hypothetical protein